MAKSKLIKANKKIEKAVVSSYKKIENGSTKAFKRISDKFVDNYLTKDGESVAEAQKRLKKEIAAQQSKDRKY